MSHQVLDHFRDAELGTGREPNLVIAVIKGRVCHAARDVADRVDGLGKRLLHVSSETADPNARPP